MVKATFVRPGNEGGAALDLNPGSLARESELLATVLTPDRRSSGLIFPGGQQTHKNPIFIAVSSHIRNPSRACPEVHAPSFCIFLVGNGGQTGIEQEDGDAAGK